MAQNKITMQRIKIADMLPAANHTRTDLQPNDLAYEQLLRSIDEFGYIDPIIWNKRTGNIVGGHQRFKILKHLGETEVDCVVIDEDEVREAVINITLNKVTGSWCIPKLATAFTAIEGAGFNLDVTGWSLKERDGVYQEAHRIANSLKSGEDNPEDEIVEVEGTPITQRGDIWCLGNHRLMCGDSTSAEDVALLMDGRKADMVFTDPPWNVDYGSDKNHPSWKPRTIMNDNMSNEDFLSFLTKTFAVMASVSKAGCPTYCVMSAQEWGNVMLAMRECNYHWSSTIIWAKDSLVMSRKDYHTQYEPIWYGWLSGAARLVQIVDKKHSDLWEFKRPKRSDEHPTMKPVELVKNAIVNSSRNGNVVLDLFGGSGTTLIASEYTGRICYLMELDPRFADVIFRRYIKIKKSSEDVFLIRNGEKIPYCDVPDAVETAPENESGEVAQTLP
jgi:DNA modification methylase